LKINQSTIHKLCKSILLFILVGILAGLSSAIFLSSLNLATNIRTHNPYIIWFLPLAGLITGLLFHLAGNEAAKGSNLIIEEIHNPKKILPLKIAPLTLVASFFTHLFGGSAGREGAIVQVATTLADQINKFFNLDPNERKIVLMAGAGAGFGSALGAPIAGLIFGMEVIYIGKLHLKYWPQCLVSSFTAYYLCLLLKVPHSMFPKIQIVDWNFLSCLYIAFAGIVFGITAFLFIRLTHFMENIFKKFISRPYLIPFTGGVILVLSFQMVSNLRYMGLGTQYIQEALVKMSSFRDPVFKTIFSSLTIASGFKGGEFIPLVFIGTTLGSALGILLPISFSLLAALGFAGVFAGAANTLLPVQSWPQKFSDGKYFFTH